MHDKNRYVFSRKMEIVIRHFLMQECGLPSGSTVILFGKALMTSPTGWLSILNCEHSEYFR